MNTKTGDLWQMGGSRLLCGDSTIAENIKILMDGKTADMVFTDPPYNIDLVKPSNDRISGIIRFHRKTAAIEYMTDFKPDDFLKILHLPFEPGKMNAYIFCSKNLLPEYLNFAVQNKWAFNVLVWLKPCGAPIGNTHWPNMEYIVHYRKSAIWNNNLPWVDYSKWLQFNRVKKSAITGNHPTVKPVDLLANEIQISSNQGGIIVDLFGGSGSTLIAAEQTGRKCFMMEIDPHYCDIIVRRWEYFTGEKAVKIDET